MGRCIDIIVNCFDIRLLVELPKELEVPICWFFIYAFVMVSRYRLVTESSEGAAQIAVSSFLFFIFYLFFNSF